MACVTIDVDLDEFDTSELIEQLQARGYIVSGGKEKPKGTPLADDLDEAVCRLRRGEVEDALYLIARGLGPQFRDLPEAVSKRLHT